MPTFKIFIVDDHRTMTDGLAEYLRAVSTDETAYQVIGRVQSGPELLRRLPGLPVFDVLLMDLEMPEMSGFEVLEKLRELGSKIPVIMLTMHNSWSFANQAIQKGARGYALKSSGGRAIVEAIQVVLQGKVYIDRDIDAANTADVPVEWSPEDRGIIHRILEEYTSEQIGRAIGRSEEYVEGRRRAIMRAIGARNVVGIVKYALRKKIGPEAPDRPRPVASPSSRFLGDSIKVFLVDDHGILIDSLEAMLRPRINGFPAIDIVGKAQRGDEALEKIAALPEVDVVLLDKELPDTNGIELIPRIRAIHGAVKCIILSFDGSAVSQEAALAAGAVRYLVKTAASREAIVSAIVEAAGSRSVPAHPRAPDKPDVFDALDRAILTRVLDELNNEAIADQLGVSVSTVAHRRARMIETVGARSVVGLAVYAVRSGLYGG